MVLATMPSRFQILFLEVVHANPSYSFCHPTISRTTSQAFFEQRPMLSAVIIFIVYLITATLFGLAAKAIFPQYQPDFIALLGMSVVVALVLSVLGWWKEAGFNLPIEWRDSRLVIIPFIIVLGLPFLKGIKTTDAGTLLYLVIGYALTGFMEEGSDARYRPARAQANRHNP